MKNLQKQLIFRLQDKKGGVLFLSLWATFFLGSLALSLSSVIRQKALFITHIEDRDRLQNLLDSLRERMVYEFSRTQNEDFFSLNQLNIILSNLKDEFEGNIILQSLEDEERKININNAEREVLKRLFLEIGLSEELSEEISSSLIDWRDSDSQLIIPLGSAEDSYYRNLTYPYEAKDKNFEVLEEILLVKGVEDNVFDKICNYLTIYGEGKININTAPPLVLEALGIRKSLVEKILAYRLGEDGIAGTEDDKIFNTISELINKLSESFRLSKEEIAEINNIANKYLTTNSYNFTAKFEAKIKNKRKTLKVVVNNSGKILFWSQL